MDKNILIKLLSLQEVIEFVPNATDQPVRLQRHQINYKVKDYKDDGRMITQDLM